MTDWLDHLLPILAVAILCGCWAALQRWIARRAPGVRGPESGCGQCSCGDGEACRSKLAD